MKHWKLALGISLSAILAVGCGGGGGSIAPKSSVSSVKIFGDSLMDSGVFGYKFTVQGNDPATAKPFQLFAERVAASFGYTSICPYFQFSSGKFGLNTAAGCTNYSVAGGRINNLTNTSAPTHAAPFEVAYQLEAATAGFAATDLVLIDGGSNDLADLTGAYLGATDLAGIGKYVDLLKTLVPGATVDGIVTASPDATKLATAGGAYAQALAASLVQTVKNKVVAKDVGKVLVLNSSDITMTPRFQTVLAGVKAQAGEAQAVAVQGAVRAWTQVFNAGLVSGFAGTRVQIYDFYKEGNLIFNDAAQLGLSNSKTPVCPKVEGGLDSVTGEASLSLFPTVAVCNPNYMSTHIPTGETMSNWWQGYAFSDNFHPSGALHKLIAQSINVQLARLGWL